MCIYATLQSLRSAHYPIYRLMVLLASGEVTMRKIADQLIECKKQHETIYELYNRSGAAQGRRG
jgi:hypothetical protein